LRVNAHSTEVGEAGIEALKTSSPTIVVSK
jgi:hypothetical protein